MRALLAALALAALPGAAQAEPVGSSFPPGFPSPGTRRRESR